MGRLGWPAILVGALAACAAPELKPAAGARTLAADEDVAVAVVGGVSFRVDGGAWDGFPAELDAVVPVRVTIENDGAHPVRIRFEDMALMGPEGTEFAALPPLRIDAVEMTEGSVGGTPYMPYRAGFGWDRFLVADPYMPYYAGLDPWVGPFAYDPLYYDRYYGEWPVELPTESMIERALPEGVVSPGGRVSGFVYFEDVPDDVERVTFRAEVVNASTGERMGVVSIPFVAKDA